MKGIFLYALIRIFPFFWCYNYSYSALWSLTRVISSSSHCISIFKRLWKVINKVSMKFSSHFTSYQLIKAIQHVFIQKILLKSSNFFNLWFFWKLSTYLKQCFTTVQWDLKNKKLGIILIYMSMKIYRPDNSRLFFPMCAWSKFQDSARQQ